MPGSSISYWELNAQGMAQFGPTNKEIDPIEDKTAELCVDCRKISSSSDLVNYNQVLGLKSKDKFLQVHIYRYLDQI
jgi:hypothetical protein